MRYLMSIIKAKSSVIDVACVTPLFIKQINGIDFLLVIYGAAITKTKHRIMNIMGKNRCHTISIQYFKLSICWCVFVKYSNIPNFYCSLVYTDFLLNQHVCLCIFVRKLHLSNFRQCIFSFINYIIIHHNVVLFFISSHSKVGGEDAPISHRDRAPAIGVSCFLITI